MRYAVTETCLALTIFRDEISFHVMALFTALVFLKIFHWLAQARIEFVGGDSHSWYSCARVVLIPLLFVWVLLDRADGYRLSVNARAALGTHGHACCSGYGLCGLVLARNYGDWTFGLHPVRI